jgi:3-methyladenine DNA glycosylase/8-oxoguanine DNA glycosylase
MAKTTLAAPSGVDLRSTVRGTKDPVLVGPTETWWVTRTPEGPGTLQMVRVSTDSIEAEAWGPGADWMLAQAPRLMGADDDLTGFEPPAELRRAWRAKPFLLGRTDRLWDAIVGAVFGQKVQVANAHRARKLLARRHGEPAPGPRPGWVLPAPEQVARMGYHQFHPLGVERKRAEILIRAAREMPRLERLTDGDWATADARLQQIRGIGPWTAALVTAAAMGNPDAVPVGDFHVPNTVAWVLAGEPRASDERMLELLEPYAGHRWRVVRLAKSNGPAPKYGPKLSLKGDGLHLGR